MDQDKVDRIKQVLLLIRRGEISASMSGIEYYWGTPEYEQAKKELHL